RRGEDEGANPALAHRFERGPGGERVLLDVEKGVLEAPARLGIGGEGKDDVVAGDDLGQSRYVRGRVTDVQRNDLDSVRRAREELTTSNGEVVEDGDARPAVDERVDEVTADETGAADDCCSFDPLPRTHCSHFRGPCGKCKASTAKHRSNECCALVT